MTIETLTQAGILLIAIAVVAVIVQVALMPRYVFLVQIHGNDVRVTKGKVPGEFVDNIREICREFGIVSGWIGGIKRGKTIALRFSSNFPANCQQRLRNVWFT